MSVTRTSAVAAVFAALASASALAQDDACGRFADTPHTAPSPERVEGATSYVYRTVDGADLRLHVFAPAAPASELAPAVVFLFGGGWMIGNVTDFAPQAAHVAGRGAVAILADYRTHCRNGVDIVDEVEDAKALTPWIRANAAALGVDQARIALVGGSSGGHLAASAAVFAEPGAAPDRLYLFYPCVDATLEDEMEFSGPAIAARGAEVSPLQHLEPGLPPVVLFQGTEDYLFESSATFCDRARANGDNCELVVYEGAPRSAGRAGCASRERRLSAGCALSVPADPLLTSP